MKRLVLNFFNETFSNILVKVYNIKTQSLVLESIEALPTLVMVKKACVY